MGKRGLCYHGPLLRLKSRDEKPPKAFALGDSPMILQAARRKETGLIKTRVVIHKND